ncbi:MAG: hypothetical protein R3C03_09960 [Pirellulaceae bacterium]
MIVAASIAWFGHGIIRSRTERPIVAKIETDGGKVYYNYRLEQGRIQLDKLPEGSPIARTLFGDDIFSTAISIDLTDSKSLSYIGDLHKLTDLTSLTLAGNKITDDCVEDLLQINKLNYLSLNNTAISADGLAKLSESTTLQGLNYLGKGFNDSHLASLTSFTDIRFLQITKTSVTDVGM